MQFKVTKSVSSEVQGVQVCLVKMFNAYVKWLFAVDVTRHYLTRVLSELPHALYIVMWVHGDRASRFTSACAWEFRSQVMGKRTCASFHKDLIQEESCEDNLYTRCIYYSKACLQLSDCYVLDSAPPPPFWPNSPFCFILVPPHARTHTHTFKTQNAVW